MIVFNSGAGTGSTLSGLGSGLSQYIPPTSPVVTTPVSAGNGLGSFAEPVGPPSPGDQTAFQEAQGIDPNDPTSGLGYDTYSRYTVTKGDVNDPMDIMRVYNYFGHGPDAQAFADPNDPNSFLVRGENDSDIGTDYGNVVLDDIYRAPYENDPFYSETSFDDDTPDSWSFAKGGPVASPGNSDEDVLIRGAIMALDDDTDMPEDDRMSILEEFERTMGEGSVEELAESIERRKSAGAPQPSDGMSDSIPAVVDGKQAAELSEGEFIFPADAVADLGNGSSEAGARRLQEMVAKIRQARHGTTAQPPAVDGRKILARGE